MDNMNLLNMICIAIAVGAIVVIWFGLQMAKAVGNSRVIPMGGYRNRGDYGFGIVVVFSLVVLGIVVLVYYAKQKTDVRKEETSKEEDNSTFEYRISEDTVPMSYYEEPEAYPSEQPPVQRLEEDPTYYENEDQYPNEYSNTNDDMRLNVSPSGRNSNEDNGNEMLIRFNDAPEPPRQDEGHFYLQKGVAASEEEAINNQQQLEKQYPGMVHIGHDLAGSYLAYKILLGPFASKEEALNEKKSKGEWVRDLETDDTIEVIY